MQPIIHQSKINLVLFTAYNKDDFATEHLPSGLLSTPVSALFYFINGLNWKDGNITSSQLNTSKS